MILIADGGSTKCDWVLVDKKGKIHAETQSKGMNPNVIQVKNIPSEIEKNPLLNEQKHQITHLFFYGSGCGLAENQEKMQGALKRVFPQAKIQVKDDLMGAVFSAFDGRPALVGILGTGSNVCLFDGETLERKLPSLGYILGDEGSGCDLGKALVKAYFMKKLPSELVQDFEQKYPLQISDFIQKIYKETQPNAYLASFNAFIFEKKSHLFIQDLIKKSFRSYFEYQVLPYFEKEKYEIHFVGSIAFLYEDFLREIAEEFGIKLGKIIKKPIENLVNYHKNYIFPHLE